MSEESLQSTAQDVLAGRALPRRMLRDLLAIAQLHSDTCDYVASTLRKVDGVADSQLIESAVIAALGPERAALARSISRTIRSVDPSAIAKIVQSVRQWSAGYAERQAIFSEAVLEQLAKNLDALVADCPPLALMRKAEWLLRAIGNEFEDVDIVCDLRPVFDDERSKVEAFVLIANLKLLFLKQDGSRDSFELCLTEDELETIHITTETALEKMRILNGVRSTLSLGDDQELSDD